MYGQGPQSRLRGKRRPGWRGPQRPGLGRWNSCGRSGRAGHLPGRGPSSASRAGGGWGGPSKSCRVLPASLQAPSSRPSRARHSALAPGPALADGHPSLPAARAQSAPPPTAQSAAPRPCLSLSPSPSSCSAKLRRALGGVGGPERAAALGAPLGSQWTAMAGKGGASAWTPTHGPSGGSLL